MYASGMRRRVMPSGHAGLRRILMLIVPLASILAGVIVLMSMFEPSDMLHALEGANVVLIALAFLLGAIIEVIEARRAALMLSRHRPVPWGQTFGIQVVSLGFGHLIPLAPTTIGLRSLLTSRINGIPLLFSAGVFLVSNILDNAALLPLLAYLLAMVSMPVWLRILLSGILVQTIIFLLVPLVGGSLVALLLRKVAGESAPGYLQRAARAIECAVNGMALMTKGDWKRTTLVVSLTMSMAVLGMLRLELLLQAFGLQPSFNQLCLLMILSTLVGRLPVPIPGAGTWAAAKALMVAGVRGSGVGGYILVMRAISSIETPILALGVLLWWSLPWSPSTIRLRDIRAMRPAPQPVPVPIESATHRAEVSATAEQ